VGGDDGMGVGWLILWVGGWVGMGLVVLLGWECVGFVGVFVVGHVP
jgi:hypothetical protein